MLMNKLLLATVILISGIVGAKAQTTQICRQGEVTFFSYTSVEDIEATNNTVLSFFYPNTNEIGVQVLMRAFTFQKSLMYEHFNESYIESDLYPKAFFKGKIIDFDPNQEGEQTKIIKGEFSLRDVTMPVEFKTKITRKNQSFHLSGTLSLTVDDYNIKIPALLAPNIAKNIEVSFNFQYAPDESKK